MESAVDLLRRIASGELPPAPIQTTLGFALAEVEEGRAVFSAEVGTRHDNPLGTMHGGVAATRLDSAMGCAVHSTLGPGETDTTATTCIVLPE
jgi:acyl-coenzyme A thioesterase PaaI-like protein